MKSLSILIPARNEPYLQKTIDDILLHSRADTEIVVGLDGYRVDLKQDKRVKVFLLSGIGQRAATNVLARQATGKYLMKVDAHCSFSDAFDEKMLNAIDDWTIMSPYLLVLDKETWTPKHFPISSSYCFDTDFVFQYNQKAENKELINETMCLQGSAWMVHKIAYWKWNLCDESLGSWGSQGVEIGIKAWLNGGRCVTNKDVFYAHLFREKDEDFPYERDKLQMQFAHEEIKRRYKNKIVSWLIVKFGFPADWSRDAVDNLPSLDI